MEKNYSLYDKAMSQIELTKIYQGAVATLRKSPVRNQTFVPPETRRETREECLQRIKGMLESSERMRKSSDEFKALVESNRVRCANLKSRQTQKQFVIKVPAGTSVVLVFG